MDWTERTENTDKRRTSAFRRLHALAPRLALDLANLVDEADALGADSSALQRARAILAALFEKAR
jgi:hypothetical protein